MSELPERWAEYENLQIALDRSDVDDIAWGLEAGLNRFLAHESEPDDIRRAVQSGSRKERYRARLLRIHPPFERALDGPESAFDTKEQLDRMQARVTADDWGILRDVAEGKSYLDIATRRKTTQGALRTRVSRIRQNCRGNQVPTAGNRSA